MSTDGSAIPVTEEISSSGTSIGSSIVVVILIATILIILVVMAKFWFGKQDCQVNEWKAWEDCSVECGGGKRIRRRDIMVEPKNGGRQCPVLVEEEECNTQQCNTDCQVGPWSEWSECNAECGGGTQTRKREITLQPSGLGKSCPILEESRPCNTDGCMVDCVVSDWSEWSECNVPCGGGEMARIRSVITPASNGGAACPVLIEKKSCNPELCQQDCVVSDWLPEGKCSLPCGEGGVQKYTRNIITHPAHGGAECPILVKTEPCAESETTECAINQLKLIKYDGTIDDNTIKTLDFSKLTNVTQLRQGSRYTLVVYLNPITTLVDPTVTFNNIAQNDSQNSNKLSQKIKMVTVQRGYIHFTTGNFFAKGHYRSKTPFVEVSSLNGKEGQDQKLTLIDDSGKEITLPVYYDPNIGFIDLSGRSLRNTAPIDLPNDNTARIFKTQIGQTKIQFTVRHHRVTNLKVTPPGETIQISEMIPSEQNKDMGSFDGNNLVLVASRSSDRSQYLMTPGLKPQDMIEGRMNGHDLTETGPTTILVERK